MDEKDKKVPQPQQPSEESQEAKQPVAEPEQLTQPEAESATTAATAVTEPVQPQQPAMPQQPVAPDQPVAPQPTTPVQAAESAQPTQPMQPNQPAQPTQPMQAGTAPQQAPQQPCVPQPQQPGAGGYVPPQSPVNAGVKPKGTASLVCGILALLIGWFSPIVGVILGVVAIVLASKAVKTTGKNGKTTGGKVCGIIGIVLAAISFILGLLITFGVIGSVVTSSFESPSSSSLTSSSLIYPEELTADEQACYDLGIQRFEALKNRDSAMVQPIVEDLDKGFEETTGFTHADLGVSGEALAAWLLTDFEYSYDGVYVDEEEGTATMYIDVTMRDSYAFSNNYYDAVSDFTESSEFDAMSQSEALARLGELYNRAMEDTTETTSYYAAIDFVQNADGTWVVDEESWNDEMHYMFDVYGYNY